MTDWKPIESAPRDGTAVLVSCPDQPLLIAAWDGETKSWYCWNTKSTADLLGDLEPTHWMPLPPPPQEGEE